jgi:uncharacterized protein YneF (UPF0154 family)
MEERKWHYWIQIALNSLWIIGAIVLIVYWFFVDKSTFISDKNTIKADRDGMFSVAIILIVLGVWKITETYKTHKYFKKQFKKNEEEIENFQSQKQL